MRIERVAALISWAETFDQLLRPHPNRKCIASLVGERVAARMPKLMRMGVHAEACCRALHDHPEIGVAKRAAALGD